MPTIENTAIVLTLWATIGYLLGAVPFGVILARAMGLGNLREIGSGNIGATNVLRTGNKKAAALTLLFDAGKGAVVVLLARAMAGEDAAQIAALAAFLGHCFPIWLGFRGGKGVATYIGIVLALAWPVGLAVCATWLAVALLLRYSSLAALMAAGMGPLWASLLGYGDFFFLGIIFAVLIYARHWANITRLRAGTETKIGAKT
ncbi:MAG: acyl-phosphate glycerol 3-phosphate acyltransferase [Thalassobium sp.]|uniref:glycerol-3-phosphate 1-O-acyltransferase PlsY n=1 Tax=Octadecabacter sp. SW4 TaxID=2602067 RepID=UPI000C0F537E|nr:glycerol-3-phosphate 1-O-acyltransferase PlsY [Octadecabacter sp. SW4]PHQ84251.1 MAG: acyl-phosphate glycerol 3-phosphate acyltransferase [Thalassobium sp.]QEE36789.1 glycerol-3-phosphate 1-O-acyltransferase PlsY [Octadecabacter sp. SW4]